MLLLLLGADIPFSCSFLFCVTAGETSFFLCVMRGFDSTFFFCSLHPPLMLLSPHNKQEGFAFLFSLCDDRFRIVPLLGGGEGEEKENNAIKGRGIFFNTFINAIKSRWKGSQNKTRKKQYASISSNTKKYLSKQEKCTCGKEE